MKTVEELHEMYQQNDERYFEAEMKHDSGEISSKVFRQARLNHRLTIKNLDYQMSRVLAAQEG